MINRLCYRLRYGNYSLLLVGLILIFIEDFRVWGIIAIVTSIVAFVVLNWLIDKTANKPKYDADENGNAKPNYR